MGGEGCVGRGGGGERGGFFCVIFLASTCNAFLGLRGALTVGAVSVTELFCGRHRRFVDCDLSGCGSGACSVVGVVIKLGYRNFFSL